MKTIDTAIEKLISYGLKTDLFLPQDRIYMRNRLYELLEIDGSEDESHEGKVEITELESILNEILDYAATKGLLDGDSITQRDLFSTKIMGLFVKRPSEITKDFWKLYRISPKAATDFFYLFSQNTDYIRRYRICKDEKWVTKTPYGDLDITINLSKPEKDPKAIAAAQNSSQNVYPKCQLCMENEGYAGRMNHPARQNHRIIPVTIQNREWGFQYSPYVYYNEHCIVFNGSHIPMKIDHNAFCKLFDFVKQFPHYFVGSNADLPIVGGSILSHDHFQGGCYEFAMAKAPVEKNFVIEGYEDVKSGVVKWPMSVIRLSSSSSDRIIELADKVLDAWRRYSDENVCIYAVTDGELHHTITPIARKRGTEYELDLVLRSNITTKEHPLGLYHPHAGLHHIKKENIGLIEVMGLAILPARLKSEMEHLAEALLRGENIRENEELRKHADWADEIREKYKELKKDTIHGILREEIGLVFMQVLEDAGVFKRTKAGQEAFARFLAVI